MKYHFLVLLLSISSILSAQIYRTEALSPDINTIEINVNGDKQRNSIVRFNLNESIHLSFDRLSEDAYNRLRYRIIYCDADWKKNTNITEFDYMSGFNDNPIESHDVSLNTTVEYAHFSLTLPNEDVSLKISGNYAIEVYDEDEEDLTLLTARFSVEETQVNIGYKLTTNTDIDSNKGHQQLLLDVIHPNLNIRNPMSDIKVYVYQNNRPDTERILTKPTTLGRNKISYGHFQDLIFEAGNEYRRFETTSYKYNGMNVAHIAYDNPYYNMHIATDKSRADWVYNYDQDQNGRYFIRNKGASFNETEADYFVTHFTLSVEKPYPYDIYINGDFTNGNFSDDYKMTYDEEFNEYYLLLMLKQGLYNYQYLAKIDDKYSTNPVEGNYYEAENEYLVKVYYRPMGQRYDSLIGSLVIYSRAK